MHEIVHGSQCGDLRPESVAIVVGADPEIASFGDERAHARVEWRCEFPPGRHRQSGLVPYPVQDPTPQRVVQRECPRPAANNVEPRWIAIGKHDGVPVVGKLEGGLEYGLRVLERSSLRASRKKHADLLHRLPGTTPLRPTSACENAARHPAELKIATSGRQSTRTKCGILELCPSSTRGIRRVPFPHLPASSLSPG